MAVTPAGKYPWSESVKRSNQNLLSFRIKTKTKQTKNTRNLVLEIIWKYQKNLTQVIQSLNHLIK